MVSLPERRRAVTYLRNEHEVSERRACQVVSIHRSSYRHVVPRLGWQYAIRRDASLIPVGYGWVAR